MEPSILTLDDVHEWPRLLWYYIVILTVGILAYTGFGITAVVFVFLDDPDELLPRWAWIAFYAVASGFAVLSWLLWHKAWRHVAAATADRDGLEELSFPRIGKRFALADHNNVVNLFLLMSVTTLIVSIVVTATDAAIDYVLGLGASFFLIFLLPLYLLAMWQTFSNPRVKTE
jgi:hypothetical protein